MKYLIIIVSTSLLLLSSCKLSKTLIEAGEPFRKEIDEFQAELFPLDTAMKKVMVGLLDGAATESSKDNIDTLSKRLTNGITKFLNERLKEMDTKSLGSNLIAGVKDEISSDDFQDTLRLLINGAFSDLRTNLNLTVDSVFIGLSSGENKARLESMMASLFTENNSELMRSFLNKGIEGISFTSIADSLRNNLLNEETQAALNNIIPTKIDTILEKTEGILDKLGENGEGFIERNIWTIIGGIASLMLLGTLLWLWRKRSKENKMNDVIMASINDMGDDESKVLKEVIKKNAIQRGIEASLNKRLVELGLAKDDRWKKS